MVFCVVHFWMSTVIKDVKYFGNSLTAIDEVFRHLEFVSAHLFQKNHKSEPMGLNLWLIFYVLMHLLHKTAL